MVYRKLIKPIIDFLAAVIGLTLLSPIFIIVLICLLIVNNGKPFFLQKRPGKDEKIFSIIKFKTMNDKKDEHDELLPALERITKVGSFIRNYSLDEIPQLINVLKGDMSLIGPRPLLIRYLPHYNSVQKKRHDIKPGITGWAQVNGRNTINWEQKFALDIHYVENMSLLLDIKIVFLTIYKIFAKKGIYDQNNEIGSEFTGSDS